MKKMILMLTIFLASAQVYATDMRSITCYWSKNSDYELELYNMDMSLVFVQFRNSDWSQAGDSGKLAVRYISQNDHARKYTVEGKSAVLEIEYDVFLGQEGTAYFGSEKYDCR